MCISVVLSEFMPEQCGNVVGSFLNMPDERCKVYVFSRLKISGYINFDFGLSSLLLKC